MYLLETLKLLQERQWLVPRLGEDGIWRLEPTVEMTAAIALQPRGDLVPPSVRAMIRARLSQLKPPVRQLVMASAVLRTHASAKLLWQVADLGVQAGLEALEEAVRSGILCEEEAGTSRLGSYRFAHDLIREVVYSELGEVRRHILHQRALARLEIEGARACELAYHAQASGQAREACAMGAPPTQPLTIRARETFFWGMLALAQLQAGQVQQSMDSGRTALALAKENKNVWAHVSSTAILTFGLLEAGAYEEAFVLMQSALALARTLPQMVIFQLFVHALGSTYHVMQQWEEAYRTLEEAEAVAETLDLRLTRVVALSQLCMNCAEAGQWDEAYQYAVKAVALRKNADTALIPLDFYLHYEIEALLHRGDERQAREALHRLGEHLGPYRRFRIPYLRSRALLATWEGHSEQAIDHLREAAQLAADLRLPAERWQIQAVLGRLYEAEGELAQARTAWASAATIIQGLAQGIGDEARRSHFLAAPPIQQVLQQAQSLANRVRKTAVLATCAM